MLTRTCKNFSEKISKRRRIVSEVPNQTAAEKKVRKQEVYEKSIPTGPSFSQAGSRVVSCMVQSLPKAIKFQVPLQICALLGFHCTRPGSLLRCSYNSAWTNQE